MGEGIITDNPANVIPASQWKAVAYRANVPLSGVKVTGEFKRAMEQNIGYLLGSFSVEEMLRPFRERAGKPVRAGLRPPIAFWTQSFPVPAPDDFSWAQPIHYAGWITWNYVVG